jgi:uncharacterized metal-binding protein
MNNNLPLVFACSGCSNSGQLANEVALELNRRGVAEMSCLAGVGAAKAHFLKKLAKREVWVVDGCPIECALGIFDQLRECVDIHIRLHDLGVRKNDPLPTGAAFANFVDDVIEYANAKTSAIAPGPSIAPPPGHCSEPRAE